MIEGAKPSILIDASLNQPLRDAFKEASRAVDEFVCLEFDSLHNVESKLASSAVVVSSQPLTLSQPGLSLLVVGEDEAAATVVARAVFALGQWRLKRSETKCHSLESHLKELNAIGVSLSTEKDLDELLEKILAKAREITIADSGSLYLIDYKKAPSERVEADRFIRFKLAQNDSAPIELSEFTLEINPQSSVGYCVLTETSLNIEDVYALPADSAFQHNRAFDEKLGYRTKSLLVVPMRNHKNEIIGVLQLINKKQRSDKMLTLENAEREILAFNETDLELVESLASQASVAIENTRLYEEIENLFEGFIHASVLAIESRDPTTSGHSERVATMTCGLAEAVDKVSQGPYKAIHFEPRDMKELQYASLLHDFGKIGVREEVLVKAKKLYDHEIKVVKSRFELIRSTIELESNKRKTDLLLQKTRDQLANELGELDSSLANRLDEIDNYMQFVLRSSEPTVLEQGDFALLQEIAAKTFVDHQGNERSYLTKDEVQYLSIRKGSLSEEERLAIESHVTHSYNFLKQIPWTKDLRRIPSIAYAHHEKLDGSGYPLKITAEHIPPQTKMMTLTDIFDALSARDRPYKKAVPVKRALDILKMEVDDGKLDNDLYDIFIEAKVYKLVIDEE